MLIYDIVDQSRSGELIAITSKKDARVSSQKDKFLGYDIILLALAFNLNQFKHIAKVVA